MIQLNSGSKRYIVYGVPLDLRHERDDATVNMRPFKGGPIPLKISVIYALAGGLWILFSDLILSLACKKAGYAT